MAASETKRRTIIRDCKYQSISRVVQHDKAKTAISHFISTGSIDVAELQMRAAELRIQMADDDFERDVLDFNADYLDRFVEVQGAAIIPDVERLPPGRPTPIELNGVRVTAELHFRLRRITRTNKVRVGAGMLRYAKGKALSQAAAEWQSAFVHGYLVRTNADPSETPEPALCLTFDAHQGICHPAPSDSIRRFSNMEAACATIAERWANVQPPLTAVL